MKLATALTTLALLATACGGPAAAPPTTTAPPATTQPASTTSSTTTLAATATTVAAPRPGAAPLAERSRLQLVDPATLEALAPPVEVPGYVSVDQHAVLPDGRLMLLSWGGDWRRGRLTLYDPAAGAMETIASPFSSGVRVLGYSPALTMVVLMDETGDQEPELFDPFTKRTSSAGVELPDGEWYVEAALFDGGRKLALYAAPGHTEPGRPPFVRIADLEARTLGDPVELEDVVHGLVEVALEMRREPESPYGTVYPGLAFDAEAGRLYVAHADGGGLTVVDLLDETTIYSSLHSRPSLWARALSWLIPPAEAKGNEPSAGVGAFLSSDRARLFVGGVATDAWRDPETNELHTLTRPLGVTVVDTVSLQVVATLDLPVSWPVAAAGAVVLVGTSSDYTFCDEVCNPGGRVMQERGEDEHSGLYVLDAATLEVRAHHRPGANFYPRGAHRHWLVAESLGEDGLYVDSVDLTTGALAGRAKFGHVLHMVTERGVFTVDHLG